MENKTVKKIIFIIIILFFITESCSHKTCRGLEISIDKKYLDTLSTHCDFIKRYSEKEIYLINPIDSDFLYDINTLVYYKEYNSRYIIIFNSSVYMQKYFIATIQNQKLEVHPCADLFKIYEIYYPNKLIIKAYDSLLQFNSLSYGVHTLELLNKKNSISYHYADTIIYDGSVWQRFR
ncbi:MAG: hypothetical protein KBA86_00760 [Bacteroidales bacterium]|nr:hypothetical protein [Bacteroidales bacterium]